MQLFGIDLWRIILCLFLIIIVVQTANIVAFFARKSWVSRDYKKAEKIFSVASKIGNLNAKNRELYGDTVLRLGKPDEALVILRGALPVTKRESGARYSIKNLIALSYWKQGNVEEAIEELEEVADKGYKNSRIYGSLGILYNLSDKHEKAKKFNEEAYEFNKDDYTIADNLADIYAICGEYEKSAEVYEELINRDPEPGFPEAYYGYGKVLIELGRKEEGIRFIEKSLTKPFSFMSVRSKEEVEKMLEEYKA